MGGLIPLGDASRRPRGAAVATLLIILVNALVFLQELAGGNRFVRTWSAIPVRITHGHHAITLLTSMFLHASWMHIIGNMIFLWAFGPAMEDVMGHARYVIFYLAGGVTAMMAQILAAPNSTISCLGASGAIAAVMGAFIVTFPRDRIRTFWFILIFFRVSLHSGGGADRLLDPDADLGCGDGDGCAVGRCGLHGAHWRVCVRDDYGAGVCNPGTSCASRGWVLVGRSAGGDDGAPRAYLQVGKARFYDRAPLNRPGARRFRGSPHHHPPASGVRKTIDETIVNAPSATSAL